MFEVLWALVPATTLLCATVALRGPRDEGLDLAEGFLRALVALALLATVSTEALGAVSLLRVGPVRAVWLCALVLALHGARRRGIPRVTLPADPVTRGALALAAAVLGPTLVVALVAPPTTLDVLTYHLPRVMHWIQNAGPRAFPSFNYKLLAYPPGSSYLVAHAVLLPGGGDRYVALPQWFALAGCAAAAATITRRLGGRAEASVMAALGVLTLPMAVAQSMTAQNDLLAALWVLCLGCFVARPDHATPRGAAWQGAALGLVLVTKPTGLLAAAPIFGLGALRALRTAREGSARAVGHTLAAGLLALALMAPHATRSVRVFGEVFHDEGDTQAQTHGARQTASTALRYLWLNVPSAAAWDALVAAHRATLGDPWDRATTRASCVGLPTRYLAWRLATPSEDHAAGPLHFALTALGLAALARGAARGRRRARLILGIAATLGVGFLAFCTLVKWQQWGNRLTLPFALTAVTLAAMATPSSRGARLALSGALLLAALPHVAWQRGHPLLPLPAWVYAPRDVPGAPPDVHVRDVLRTPRDELRFEGYGRVREPPIQRVVGVLDHHPALRRFALAGNTELAEYLLWTALRRRQRPFVLAHATPIPATRALPPEVPLAEIEAVLVLAPPGRVLPGPALRRPAAP